METQATLNTDLLAKLTPARVEFIEEQTTRMYDFVLASREILTREAHTTLQWFFAILIGGSGYLISIFAKQYDEHPIQAAKFWWVIAPLFLAVVSTALEARRLLYKGLMTSGVKPKGNSAQNLSTERIMELRPIEVRYLEAWRIEAYANDVIRRNAEIGSAINHARKSVILIPAFTLLAIVPLGLMTLEGTPVWLAVATDLVLLVLAGVGVWAFRKSPDAAHRDSESGCPPPAPAAV